MYVCVSMCGHMQMSAAVHRGRGKGLGSAVIGSCEVLDTDAGNHSGSCLKAEYAIDPRLSPQPFIIHYWCFKNLKISIFAKHVFIKTTCFNFQKQKEEKEARF